jgi:hypothetical protein
LSGAGAVVGRWRETASANRSLSVSLRSRTATWVARWSSSNVALTIASMTSLGSSRAPSGCSAL